jgi:2-polyprenyl-3-methyl-5-hydroxy-6-metoxy-1,4-benzoquinol methylase
MLLMASMSPERHNQGDYISPSDSFRPSQALQYRNVSEKQIQQDINVILATQYNYLPPTAEEMQECRNGSKRFTETGGWCLTDDQIRKRKEKIPKKIGLANYLADFLDGKTAADVGAGLGFYKEIITKRGKARYVVAFDGAINVFTVSHGLVQYRNFARHQNIGTYDWVYSLEVAEHIAPEYEAVYLQNLARAALEGIVITWAIPGQKGDGHVNCREPEYVVTKFLELGFYQDEKELRTMAVAAGEYAKNIHVFRRASKRDK